MQTRIFVALLSALATTTSASPLRRRCSGSNDTATSTTTSTSATELSTSSTSATVDTSVTYVLPSTGGATSLPSPGNATLKHIVVGHGIQNYSCADAGATATSLGALAVLWDITALYPGSSADSLSESDWTALPPKVLRNTSMPLNLVTAGDVSAGASTSTPFPAPASLTVDGLASPLDFLGHHFFDGAGVPTFDLSGVTSEAELLKAKKDLAIAAPADADKGLTGTGAVDWLALSDKGTSENLSLVYRVVTAGGSPSACGAAGQTESVPYAAMYWLY